MKRQDCALMLMLGFVAGMAGGFSAAYLTGGFAHAQEQPAPVLVPKVITAERFEVIDPDGNRRIVIGPDLITIDSDKERALLGSSGLLFSDVIVENAIDASLTARGLLIMESGRMRLDLTMKNGDPGLRLKDQSGRVRAALGAADVRRGNGALPDRRPLASLILLDEDGKSIWSAP